MRRIADIAYIPHSPAAFFAEGRRSLSCGNNSGERMRQLSFRQYRAMDLALFAVIGAASQALITVAATRWYAEQLYVVSPVAAVTAIVMMRWGGFAALHAALGGAALSFFSGGSCKHFLIYVLGNLLSLAALPVLNRRGKETVRASVGQTLLFGAAVQELMLLGRMLMALVTGYGWQESLGFLTTDELSVVFTLVIVWIARRVDGLMEDQRHYLRRIQNEMQTEAQTKGGEQL